MLQRAKNSTIFFCKPNYKILHYTSIKMWGEILGTFSTLIARYLDLK